MLALGIPVLAWAGKVPDWVTGGASAEYPAEKYMVGIGRAKDTGNEGKDLETAENSGRAEIGGQIRVQLESTLTTRVAEEQKYAQTKHRSKARTRGTQEVVSDIMAKVNLELEGITIADTHYNKKEKQYYALAVMERRVAADNLRKFIAEKRNAAEGFFGEGKSALSARDAPRALVNYQKAQNELVQIEGKEAMLAVILGRPVPVAAEALTVWKCQAAMDQALESIRFVVQIFEVNPSMQSALVQNAIIQGLRAKGYNVMDNAAAFRGASYDSLGNASVEQLRGLPGLAGNFLILGDAEARESSKMMIGSTPAFFFLTSAELKIVNLDNGKILVNEAFDWGDKTKCGKPSRDKAASCSLDRAGEFLAEQVSQKVEEIFKSLE
jgi:hypothetical protein